MRWSERGLQAGTYGQLQGEAQLGGKLSAVLFSRLPLLSLPTFAFLPSPPHCLAGNMP